MKSGQLQWIPHEKAEEYHRNGWEIHPIEGNHKFYSFMAYKEDEMDSDPDDL